MICICFWQVWFYGLAAGYPMRQAIRIAIASASKNEL
jgi:hypothetical protein